jgi:hypothetical protein
MTYPTPTNNYAVSVGAASTAPFITIIENRAPTGNDGPTQHYLVGQRWIDTSTNSNEYFLLNYTSLGGVVQANWVQIAGGSNQIINIDGDTGSITGSTVTIYANNAALNCGESVSFVNSGTVSTLNVTDVNNNTIIGKGSGKSGMTGTLNTCLGYLSGSSLTGGNYNILIGNLSGNNLTTTETGNILVNNAGVNAESHTIRIGTQGSTGSEQNACYIAGIYGNSPAAPQMATVNSTGQMGSQAIPALNLVQTVTGSGSASLSVTSGLSYKILFMEFSVLVGTAGANILLQTSTNGGSTWTTTGYASGVNSNPYNSAAITNTNATSGIIVVPDAPTTGGCSGYAWAMDFSNAGGVTKFNGQSTYDDNASGTWSFASFGGQNPASGVNAIRLIASTGTITGSFSVYGLTN